jgi:hypothetical protein
MAKRQKIIAIVDDDPSMLRATVLPLDRHGLLSSLKTTLIDSKFAEDGLCLECQQCPRGAFRVGCARVSHGLRKNLTSSIRIG